MTKSHSVIIPLIGTVADELDRFARSNMLIDIAAAIDPCGRFALSASRASVSALRCRCRISVDTVLGRTRSAWIVTSAIRGQANRVQAKP
jgi:hypothetical protein